MTAPSWYAKLPTARGKKLLAIDNNVISGYFFGQQSDPALQFIFGDPLLQMQCSRQVIDEALNHPGLAVGRRQQVWTELGELQAKGRLLLSGTSQMAPGALAVYRELARLLEGAKLSKEDAALAADAIVKKVPLLTYDERFKRALDAALTRPSFVLRRRTAWATRRCPPTNQATSVRCGRTGSAEPSKWMKPMRRALRIRNPSIGTPVTLTMC